MTKLTLFFKKKADSVVWNWNASGVTALGHINKQAKLYNTAQNTRLIEGPSRLFPSVLFPNMSIMEGKRHCVLSALSTQQLSKVLRLFRAVMIPRSLNTPQKRVGDNSSV